MMDSVFFFLINVLVVEANKTNIHNKKRMVNHFTLLLPNFSN